MEFLYQLYISYRIPYRTPREASYGLPREYLMTYVICSGFIKGTLTSWALGFFSYNPSIKWARIYGGNSPMLGSIFFLTKALMGLVSLSYIYICLACTYHESSKSVEAPLLNMKLFPKCSQFEKCCVRQPPEKTGSSEKKTTNFQARAHIILILTYIA